MSQTGRGLKQIHELNIQLRTVQEKFERGPKRIRAREQLIGSTDWNAAAPKLRPERATQSPLL